MRKRKRVLQPPIWTNMEMINIVECSSLPKLSSEIPFAALLAFLYSSMHITCVYSTCIHIYSMCICWGVCVDCTANACMGA